MRYTRLGKTDLCVSRLGMDCRSFAIPNLARSWNPLSYEGRMFAERTVHAALDAGINFFDTSSEHVGGKGETLLGKALLGRRSDAILASEVAVSKQSATDVERSVLASMRRLRTDYLDVIFFEGGGLRDADDAALR